MSGPQFAEPFRQDIPAEVLKTENDFSKQAVVRAEPQDALKTE
jgi:hypothetical protein